ncbi:MAG: hypothetical protein HY782_07420 [Chloroflexi bacterium]|nr:hypothetical protein [Chloroflexota bacterium]
MSPLPAFIFGMHDPGAEQIFLTANKPGWIVVTVKVNPPDSNGDFTSLAAAGFGVIVRLNNGYGSDGTLPVSNRYDSFAQQCATFVSASHGASIWLIGNETNLAFERPGNVNGSGGEVITPTLYGQCFSKCRAAIKNVPGHATDWVIPAPVAPWNTQTQYPANPSGDWIKYFQDILAACANLNASPDALALHTYTHGFNAGLIASERKMSPPFDNRRAEFRAYRDFLAAVPSALKSLPVFITETQAADPDWWQNSNIGWIQQAYSEINNWNAVQANQPIQALCLFRWITGEPRWSISDKPALQNDFRAALQNNFRVRWPGPAAPDPVAAAAVAAALKLRWMPINTGAALYKFAQQNNLGYPQTDEFEFTFNNATYVSQVYNLGIVYVKKGDWGNIRSVAKPAEV